MKRYIILKTRNNVPRYNYGGLAGDMMTRQPGAEMLPIQPMAQQMQQEQSMQVAQTQQEQDAITDRNTQTVIGTAVPNPATQQQASKIPKAQSGWSSDPTMSSFNMFSNQQPGLSKYQLGMLNGGGQQFNKPPILSKPQMPLQSMQSIQPTADAGSLGQLATKLAPTGVSGYTAPTSSFSGMGKMLRGAGESLKSNLKSTVSSGSGIAGIANTVSGVGNLIGQKVIDKNKKEYTDNFGLVDPDEKAITKGGALSGAMSGLAQGASAGAMLGPWGAAIGAVGGLIGGLFAGRAKAKKAAAKAQKEYDTKYAKAHSGAVRNQDVAAAQALASMQQPQAGMMFRNGGKLMEKPGAVNIITKGKLHKENNNLGNKDKGIPVVSSNGKKEYEVEKEELILRRDATLTLEDLVRKYDETKDDSVLEELGKFMSAELLKNTQDNSDKYKVKVKNES